MRGEVGTLAKESRALVDRELPFETVDLDTLPIPQEWELVCRECRYPLGGLTERRCPECGWEFEPARIIAPWTRVREPHYSGHEFPRPRLAWRCVSCDASLAGATSEACASCGTVNAAEDVRPKEAWFELTAPLVTDAMLLSLPGLLRDCQIPHRTSRRDQKVRDLYAGRSMEVPRVQVQGDFYFDLLAVLGAMQADADAPEWECGCGEHVPANFDVCWSCGRARGG